MALVIKDRIKETATTTGTGTFTLGGAVSGFQAFSEIGNGNTTYYCIEHATENEFEVGLGTYTLSGTTLARTTIITSSNAGNAVNFSAGDKNVFVTVPATKTIKKDASDSANITSSDVTSALGFTPISSADGGNAATLDSLDSTQFLRSDTTDTFTGSDFIIDNELQITNGDGTNTHFNYDNGGSQNYIRGSRLDIDVTGITSISYTGVDALNFDATTTTDSRGISFNSRTALSADSSDGWLRLNQDSEFGNGVYTPGNVRADGTVTAVAKLNIGTASSLSSTGQLNIYRAGSPYIGWYASSTSRGAYQQYIASGDRMLFGHISDLQSEGNITAYASDERLKRDFNKVENALEKVCSLEGVTYQWDEKKCVSVSFKPEFHQTEMGLRAQQVQGQFPEVVTAAPFDLDEEGNSKSGDDYLTMRYERLVPALIEAIKELKAEVDDLKRRIEDINGSRIT